MIKNLNELTAKELAELMEKNSKLYFELQDYAMDRAYFWTSEYLDKAPKCIDYSIGLCNHNYVRFTGYGTTSEYYDILRWFNQLQADYCYLYGDEEEWENVSNRIDRYISVIADECNGYINVKEQDLDNLWERLEGLVNDELDKICKQLVSEYEYFEDAERIAEYVLEMEFVDHYYMLSDGSVYRKQEDKLIA